MYPYLHVMLICYVFEYNAIWMFAYLNSFSTCNVWILHIIKFYVSCLEDMWREHVHDWKKILILCLSTMIGYTTM